MRWRSRLSTSSRRGAESASRFPTISRRLRTDAAQVQRALVNVLENALKFSPAETMVVLRAESAGDDVILRVDDRGPGISHDEATTVFEPFQHTGGSGGSGLGLAIARGFVTANGGRIWVEEGSPGVRAS